MTQRMKDKVVGGVIGTSSALLVSLVMFFFGGVRTDAQSFKALVNSKVDRIELDEYKEQQDKRHVRENADIDKKIEKSDKVTNEKLDLIIKLIESK